MKFLVVCESYGPGFYTSGIAEGLGRIGHDVRHVEANVWEIGEEERDRLGARLEHNDRRVLAMASEFKPDVLFIAKGDSITRFSLDRLKSAGVLTVVWQIDDPMFFDRVSATHSPEYDLVYTTEKGSLGLYRKAGMTARWLPFGYDEACRGRSDGRVAEWRDRARRGTETYPETDVAFVGDPLVEYPSSKRHLVCSTLKEMVPSLSLMGCDREHPACSDWGGRLELSDMDTVYRRTKINLAFADQAEGGSGMKMRHMEIPGYGGFMLAEDFGYLGELFERGSEVETFATVAECARKIAYYLEHEDEREAIREAGHKRALRDHTYTERARRLAEDVTWPVRARSRP